MINLYYHQNQLSSYEIIDDYYRTYTYHLTNFTCYIHLQCNRGPSPTCLHWTGICNGQIDCLDGEFDEEHCWQLEINQCDDNEYQCANGQCIPQSFFQDDFNNPDCVDSSDEGFYIHHSRLRDGFCDGPVYGHAWCEGEHLSTTYAEKNTSFQSICNGFIQLASINIEGKNETDETECEKWPCNNIYTRCDEIWHCPNGEDEIGCDLSPILNCFKDHHKCDSSDTNQLICLPAKKANDGKIDCLGATDEPKLCKHISLGYIQSGFYCYIKTLSVCIGSIHLCSGNRDCDDGEDEQFCAKNLTTIFTDKNICGASYSSRRSDVEEFLCSTLQDKRIKLINYLSLDEMSKTFEDQTKIVTKSVFSSASIMQRSHQYQPRCHRGFDLCVWLNNEKNLTTNICLCSPSFYGDQCQYQNQRVSLTVKFQAFSDSWSILFAMMISLIDDSDERIIYSHEQITYLSNYSIHIDIYEKVSLSYRGSLLLPIKFSFLPVNRLTFIVIIPRKNENIQSCSNSQCVHGKCIIYSNNPQNASFCQCNRGWSGRYCTIPHTSICSSDSIYIGVSAYNLSVCVCPINKFGYRCLLVDTICQMNNNLTCQHGGQCIPADEYTILNQKFRCICPKGYIGDLCEIIDNKIILSFNNDIVLSQSIFIHFIEVINNNEPKRTTTFRTIPFIQKSLIIHWSKPFHLVFIELYNKIYYLAVIQNIYNRSTIINKMINSLDRCQHINELFNETFIKMHILHRIKYYHLPCQRYSSNLSCFYDDIYMCLCYDYKQQRLANCFEFNHNMKFDCLGQGICENEGLINGILSLITFNNKVICKVGCGLYLLGSSITTLLITIIFTSKFYILLLAQMIIISNQLFLKIQCLSLDFLLRVCLNMDQWLNTCVAIERAITIKAAIHFDKKKSKQTAKIVIVILLIFIVSTNIYDPIYRRLIDEEIEDDKRLWCIALYSSNLQLFNFIVHTFHFLAPFAINLISTIILITKISRQQSNVHPNQTYVEHLKKQIQEHKHLFTAPVMLVILATPRLIISFVSKCMKSTNDAWLFLIGYFISFIPPMFTFVIFVLPSASYKEELHKSIIAFRTKLRRNLQQFI
ncbi:unnamed protein product [Rotaria sp. Silwood2]|nr:unnamed protein product [Rotaria sp. Silwood2]